MSAITIGNVIEVGNIINDANAKLCKLLGQAIELRITEPEIPGLYVSEAVLGQIRADYLKAVIVDSVCEQFMISTNGLRSKSNERFTADARKIAAFLLHEYVDGITDATIGTILNIDRSTASACRNGAADLILTDKKFKFQYSQVLKILNQRYKHD